MNIMVISAHPDDETLGCGGTLLKHRDKGDKIFWSIYTKPCMPFWSDEVIENEDKQIKTVAKMYNIEKVFRADFMPTQLDEVSDRELIYYSSNIINEVNPEVIYLPYKFDIHSDHRRVVESVIASTKTFNCNSIKRILSYETLSSTNIIAPFQQESFVPNSYSDITNYIDEKIEIMRKYSTEIKEWPHPRSEEVIKSQAIYRGSNMGVKYAESFVSLRYFF